MGLGGYSFGMADKYDPHLGDRVQVKNGAYRGAEGVVRKILMDGRARVAFDHGGSHSYSWRTLTLVKRGEIGKMVDRENLAFVRCRHCPTHTRPEALAAHEASHAARTVDTPSDLYDLALELTCRPWGDEARDMWAGIADLWSRINVAAHYEGAPRWATYAALVARDVAASKVLEFDSLPRG